MKPKFKIGEEVEIVNYGHLIWVNKKDYPEKNYPIIWEDEQIKQIDIQPELVGIKAVICNVINSQNNPRYSIDIDGKKISWFGENQLKNYGKEVDTV